MPKFEKVDKHNIKIIVERANVIPLATIIDNKNKLLAQKAQIEKNLKDIEEVLTEAKKLGITPLPEVPPIGKKKG